LLFDWNHGVPAKTHTSKLSYTQAKETKTKRTTKQTKDNKKETTDMSGTV